MFAATLPDGSPVNVHVSLWQSMKAGMGFTLGAACVGLLSAILFWVIPGLGLMVLAALMRR
jgi:hypothetical protein